MYAQRNPGPLLLLIAYSMKFDETVEVIPNTVDCAVQYEIQYTERFFGYNR